MKKGLVLPLKEMHLDKRGGIYIIYNLVTMQSYVGSTENFHKRRLIHLSRLRKGGRASLKLQSAFNIHGECSFLFKILEVCNGKSLHKMESFWVNKINPEYNTQMKPVRHVFTAERNNKISKTLQKVIKRGRKSPNFGVKRPREVVERIFSTRATMKEKIYEKTSHKVIQTNISGKTIKEFLSINEASKHLGIDRDKITKICKGTWPYSNKTNFTFKFK